MAFQIEALHRKSKRPNPKGLTNPQELYVCVMILIFEKYLYIRFLFTRNIVIFDCYDQKTIRDLFFNGIYCKKTETLIFSEDFRTYT